MGYLYFAMGFSIFVEVLSLRVPKRGSAPVRLRSSVPDGDQEADGRGECGFISQASVGYPGPSPSHPPRRPQVPVSWRLP